MSEKSVTLSSAGLKNLVINSNMATNEFRFVFGEKELLINNVFAEFISPAVSRLHKSDPTINTINISSYFTNPSKVSKNQISDIFNDENISLLEQLSKGNSININENNILNMQIISILLGNEELFQKISKLNSIENDPNNIEFCLQQIELFSYCSRSSNNLFDYSKAIDFISSHFYSIEEERLKKLPKTVLYSIISNSNLKIKSEDWLFDFINQIFKEDASGSISITEFYEQLNFLTLSEAKFEEFLQKFEVNQITTEIWKKLTQCFYVYYYMAFGQADKKRYVFENENEEDESEVNNIIGKFINSKFEECEKDNREKSEVTTNDNSKPIVGTNFDYDERGNFFGIINHFIEESGGNISEKVDVTASSQFMGKPIFVTDLLDKLKYFMSDNRPNSWIKYEFINSKIKPTRYAIRTWDNMKNGGHLKNWVIEGSNTDRDDDWKILDERNEIENLNDNNAEVNFQIQTKLRQDELFKFIRLRQTGPNVSGKNFLILSAFELFGTVMNDE